MIEAPPTAARTTSIAAALKPLLDYLQFCAAVESGRTVSNLVLGNPQEMPLPGFVAALHRHADPLHKDWFAYKFSEPQARDIVAQALRNWRGLPFEPADIALTPGAFGALAGRSG